MNISKTLISTACAAVFVSSSAIAWAEPVTYQADPTHTFANFSYNHLGLSQQNNTFNDTTATLVLDLEEETGSLEVEIDLTSVNTGTAIFNEHLQGEDFFDTANYPTATFKSTEIIFEDGEPVAFEGELTIKGFSKNVTFDIDHFAATEHPMMKRPAVGANAHTTVLRSDFDMDKYVPAISDEVLITVSFEGIQGDSE